MTVPTQTSSLPSADQLSRLLAGADDERTPAERAALVRLMRLLADRPPPPDPLGLFPRYAELHARFLAAAQGPDGDQLEERFLELYCHLHGHEAPYTAAERRRVDETGGYWCHAGGLSPILKAEPWVRADTRFGDLGAGNGLQGLLLQKLFPHRHTRQLEISSRMVDCGRVLQDWLEIPEGRVEWIVGDVLDAPIRDLDLIYLYRPVRPEGEGRRFYERLAVELDATDHEVVIFSIADCLREFLPADFAQFYGDGHLTCYRRGGPPDPG